MLTHEKIVDAVEKAAQEFPLTKVAYFGSYAKGQATEESDLDLLVEFEEPAVSILTVIRLKHYLEEKLAKPIDVIHAPLPQGSIIEIGKAVNVLYCKQVEIGRFPPCP
jgi:predicted nucleotidyltransferase